MSNPYHQRIEIGPWFEVGQRLDGTSAQLYLSEEANNNGSEQRPYCIYVHVPFCHTRCSYCALYTIEVKENKGEIFNEYLTFVKQAINTHPNSYHQNSPTTVHFGGGTPLSIGLDRFGLLTAELRNVFGNSPECEWAIETTTSSINFDVLSRLKELHFQRIHLGIQTLDNDVRRKIKRRESGEAALAKIDQLQAHGFHTSVDLIIGFDEQTDSILLDDLKKLYAAGIRLFSICELRNLNIKKDDDERIQKMLKKNYNFWSLIWQFMQEHRLKPIHLGQFGPSLNDNLYFTHPARGEDCVAIGPYAHGTAGRLYYSNKLVPGYYQALCEDQSPIDFAVVYNDDIQKIRNLESQLLAHRVLPKTVDNLLVVYHRKFENIINFWLERELLIASEYGDFFTCSKEGSWFVGNMIQQARQLVNNK